MKMIEVVSGEDIVGYRYLGESRPRHEIHQARKTFKYHNHLLLYLFPSIKPGLSPVMVQLATISVAVLASLAALAAANNCKISLNYCGFVLTGIAAWFHV